jgi:hypothetical protein
MIDGSFSAAIPLPSLLGEMSAALEDHLKLLIASAASAVRASMLAFLANKDPVPVFAKTEEATVARKTRERSMVNPSQAQRRGRVLGINNRSLYTIHIVSDPTRI